MKDYYEVVKPGMVRGNLIVGAAAFLFASASINWGTFFFMCIGLSLIIASACVLNNIYDRFIDAKMERTKNRTLAAGRMNTTHALVWGTILLILGVIALYHHTNLVTLTAALAGFVLYVFAYTPLKHVSGHALWVGALAGAMPPVAGYAAAAGVVDVYAISLFIFLFLWQIPHFVAIAYYRFAEYRAAGVPLIITKEPSEHAKRIAKKVFHYSLVVLLVVSITLALWPHLP